MLPGSSLPPPTDADLLEGGSNTESHLGFSARFVLSLLSFGLGSPCKQGLDLGFWHLEQGCPHITECEEMAEFSQAQTSVWKLGFLQVLPDPQPLTPLLLRPFTWTCSWVNTPMIIRNLRPMTS